MNMNQIRYTLALASSLSFSKAAKACYVTQPTISNGISHLEKELGRPLFERSAKAVSITPFGERVLPFLEVMLTTHTALTKDIGFLEEAS